MKNIFIDFEASQYTQEIISIGAIADNGETFYSLVNAKHKVGNFVAALTGIKQEDIQTAPSPDKVFSEMFKWIEKVSQGDKTQFICYGNSDMTFAANTLKNLRNSMQAQAALSLICCNIIDYAEYVKSYFGLSQAVSLLKVAQYYSDEQLIQDHNSLNDAVLLKFAYEKIQSGAPLVENPFEEYMQKIEAYDNEDNLVETFYGMADAAKWIVETNHMPKGAHKRRIKNKIIAAAQQKQSYCGFNWVVYN